MVRGLTVVRQLAHGAQEGAPEDVLPYSVLYGCSRGTNASCVVRWRSSACFLAGGVGRGGSVWGQGGACWGHPAEEEAVVQVVEAVAGSRLWPQPHAACRIPTPCS